MSTKIVKDEIRKSVEDAWNEIVDLVRITTGPRGGNVLVDRGFGRAIFANDAGTIISSIGFQDRFKNMGADMLKGMISKLKDGRSASLIIAQSILNEGNKAVSVGINGTLMYRGITVAKDDIINELKNISRAVESPQDIENVATVSSESRDYGKLIASAIQELGVDGIITVEESDLFTVETKMSDGFEIDRGYISPWMVNDYERMETELTDVPILIIDKRVTDPNDIYPILKKIGAAGLTQAVVISQDIDGDALKMIIRSKLTENGIQILGVKIPGYGDTKAESLADLAAVVGATIIDDTSGITGDQITMMHLGRAHKVISTKDTTSIVDGGGDKDVINDRVNQIKTQMSQVKEDFKIDNFEKRIANILGKAAVIQVGANTEEVRSHAVLKIKDAVETTKKAIKNGVVSGGGVALINAKKKLVGKYKTETKEFIMGYDIVLKAITEPFEQIVVNAGRQDTEVMIRDIMDKDNNYGYDAEKNIMVTDMFEAGVIDSLEVIQDGVRFAAEEAGILLTTRGGTGQYPDTKE